MVQRLYNYGVTMSYCVHAVALSLGRDCDGVEDGSPEGCPDYACSILRVKGYSTGKVSFDAIAFAQRTGPLPSLHTMAPQIPTERPDEGMVRCPVCFSCLVPVVGWVHRQIWLWPHQQHQAD